MGEAAAGAAEIAVPEAAVQRRSGLGGTAAERQPEAAAPAAMQPPPPLQQHLAEQQPVGGAAVGAAEAAAPEAAAQQGKLVLRLVPRDAAVQAAMESARHNPRLELTMSSSKPMISVLSHLARKWGPTAATEVAAAAGGGSGGSVPVPQLHPPSDCPAALRGMRWDATSCAGNAGPSVSWEVSGWGRPLTLPPACPPSLPSNPAPPHRLQTG